MGKKIPMWQIAIVMLFTIGTLVYSMFFTDYGEQEVRQREEEAALSRERKLQEAALAIKKKYGKNALLKGMNLEEGATARTRNAQIGGHRA